MIKIDQFAQMSAAKKYLLQLSDQQIQRLVAIAKREVEMEKRKSKEKFVLPTQVKEKLSELEGQDKNSLDARNAKWMNYVKKLDTLRYTVSSLDVSMDARKLYQHLHQICNQHYLPPEFASAMIPTIMEYLKTGMMRPIILSGPPGCGKTTGARILLEMIGLRCCLISTSRVQHSHGLYGEGMVYQSPDVGAFVQGILREETLNPGFIIDEVEKCAERGTQCSVDDELLCICDGSADEFEDNFLGFQLSLKRCPIIMTCNELDKVSAPLRDRCVVYQFQDVELSRLIPMMQDYATDQQSRKYGSQVVISADCVESAVSKLYHREIRSIRQHQQMIDGALSMAYEHYLQNEHVEFAEVEMSWFEKQMVRSVSSAKETKKIGF